MWAAGSTACHLFIHKNNYAALPLSLGVSNAAFFCLGFRRFVPLQRLAVFVVILEKEVVVGVFLHMELAHAVVDEFLELVDALPLTG